MERHAKSDPYRRKGMPQKKKAEQRSRAFPQSGQNINEGRGFGRNISSLTLMRRRTTFSGGKKSKLRDLCVVEKFRWKVPTLRSKGRRNELVTNKCRVFHLGASFFSIFRG